MFTFTTESNHLYTTGSTNKKFKDGIYQTRQHARNDMYEFIDKNGLKVVQKYDDKHFKTYICDDGSYFYINRIQVDQKKV